MAILEDERWSGKLFDGDWTDGSGEPVEVRNPATDEVIARVGGATPTDVHEAAAAASSAQVAWAGTKPTERAAVLRRAGQLFEENAAEIVDWVVRETGAIQPKAGMEAHVAAQECFEASALPTHVKGQVLASDEPHWSLARRVPSGVVSVISPFNFPLILSIRSVAPALALGNAVLLKPDPRTPVSGGVLIARVLEEAGLPQGVLHVLPGGGDVGAAAVDAPEVRVVSFTGSTAAGRHVGAAGAQHLKRTHLELGGNNAMVVLPSADLDLAVGVGVMGSFFHQGQVCMTTGRHIVHRDVYDEYMERLAAKAESLVVGGPVAGAGAPGAGDRREATEGRGLRGPGVGDRRREHQGRGHPRRAVLPAHGAGGPHPADARVEAGDLRAGGSGDRGVLRGRGCGPGQRR